MSIIIGSSKKNVNNNILSFSTKQQIIDDLGNKIQSLGVDVIKVHHNNEEILWLRDIFVVIDNKCIICNLTKKDSIGKDRSKEYLSIASSLFSKYTIVQLPKDVKLEGGDIIQNGNDIFIGIGERTNEKAIDYIQYLFPMKNIIPVSHTDMHLDCVLTVVFPNTILYSRKRTYIEEHNKYINKYTLHDIDDETDGILVTNFLIIGDNIIHSNRKENKRVISILQNLGYTIHIVDINELWKEGGGIRCMTQWIQKTNQEIY
jgi:N-dimethylarginine dimethylaminohydrolase